MGKMAFAYFDLLQWLHDSNLTISVLLAVLQQVQSKLGAIPNLQLDNTSRENKNKYLLSFLAHLVELKAFKKVYISLLIVFDLNIIIYLHAQIRVNFLPVGHTHEDVDQFFSKVSTYLLRVGAETINGKKMFTSCKTLAVYTLH